MERSHSAPTHYEIAAPGVVFETIDGESIVLNLETGIYYSATGPGADLLDGIAAGLPVETVVARVLAAYTGGDEMAAAIAHFLDEIVAEGLVRPADGGSESEWAPAWNRPEGGQQVVLQRYTDMEHLLLLDPIHDIDRVDVTGATSVHG
jgi:hypothetical protein